MEEAKKKPVNLEVDKDGVLVLYVALYAQPTKSGGVRYVGFPKHHDVDHNRFITAKPKVNTANESFSVLLGNACRDKLVEYAQTKEDGVLPAIYIKPLEFSMRQDIKDGVPVLTKKGKQCFTLFLADLEIIGDVPNLKVNMSDIY